MQAGAARPVGVLLHARWDRRGHAGDDERALPGHRAAMPCRVIIDRVFTKYPFFVSRQIAAYLRREGVVVGRHRARRLMAKMGLEAIYKRPKTSQPHPQHPVFPYLLRGLQIDRPTAFSI